ncbi:MAG: arginine--tRNA ligase [Planctomycetota bacterium]|jgi:arginyl-tRNA synthetase|nr:arginine--tRNA ligase [Planctomycetota bacterium]
MTWFKRLAAETLAPLIDMSADVVEEQLVRPPKPEMGDVGFPCFTLAKTLKKAPPAIAAELASRIELPPDGVFTAARAVGPYVNFTLNTPYLAEKTAGVALANPEVWGRSSEGAGKTVVVEYSSPNIAKPLGVHHIRSTMLGAALSRIYRARGWNVIEMNHLGDWGTTFGQLMVAYKQKEKENPDQPVDVHSLLQLYLKFHSDADADAALAEEARTWFKRLEDGDAEATRLWKIFRDESVKALEKLYARMNVHFPPEGYKGEAFYNDKMAATIERIREKGLLKESDGAQVVDLEQWDMPPCIILKKDGATIYATRDLAAAEYRHSVYNFDKSLYIVANQQELHFRQVFKTLELMGYPWAKLCEHVKFGMLSFGPGMFGDAAATGSTRKGRVVFLAEGLDKAVEKARELILENARSDEVKNNVDVLAEQVGVGALIFSEFTQRRMKDVSFTWDKALNLHGDSGPYIQYTHARLSSMLRKYNAALPSAPRWELIGDHAFTKELFIKMSEYQDALRSAERENEPSLVATYLLELCAAFNRLYTDKENFRFITDDEDLTAARMSMAEALRLTLAGGLAILGLAAPEAM